MMGDTFHVLTVGWSPTVIERLFRRVSAVQRIRFSHIPYTAQGLSNAGAVKFSIREHRRRSMPQPDPGLLASLETPGLPSIRTMIVGDDVVRRTGEERALSYATYLATSFQRVFAEYRPDAILGGFDGLHSGIGLAVARQLGMPWFALHFCVIPAGLSGLCRGLTPADAVPVWRWDDNELRDLAARTLAQFESHSLTAPAYRSANSRTDVIKRLPQHVDTVMAAAASAVRRRRDPFTEYHPQHMCRQWLRKRTNLMRLPGSLITEPPASPFVLFGLHRQPESSIDVWAPFFSDQLRVVADIARATPPTHQVVVKLHKSDADNYSRRQLDRFAELPGVRLASPFAQSRAFVERADLVFAVQGTLALEAGLLRKPVLMFGDSQLVRLPTVKLIQRLQDLPAQVRQQLSEPPASRDAAIAGFADYLRNFAPGCYNDWDAELAPGDLENMGRLFGALRDFVTHGSPLPSQNAGGTALARTRH
jgi:hypothetical protein